MQQIPPVLGEINAIQPNHKGQVCSDPRLVILKTIAAKSQNLYDANSSSSNYLVNKLCQLRFSAADGGLARLLPNH